MSAVEQLTSIASAWLDRTYSGLVALTSSTPAAESRDALVFSCRPLPQPGYPATPMLAASLAVPKDGTRPFHLGNSDPWGDLTAFEQFSAESRGEESWKRRLNARGCVVSADAMLSGGRSTALPWKPADEAPGWWGRMIRRYFTGAQVGACSSWDDVISAVVGGGADSRGVLWIRREINGVEATGHLLIAQNVDSRMVLLDPQTGRLGRLEDQGIKQLTLALYHRKQNQQQAAPLFSQSAPDFESAVRKAESWLLECYGGDVILNRPSAADELRRGWLFACNTPSFLRTGDWRVGMLDAALIVPKEERGPFALPNRDPWSWLARWDGGANPGEQGMDLPPQPGPAAWLEPTLAGLRTTASAVASTGHQDWMTAISAIASQPVGARSLVWVRRLDRAGRESVGRLLVAAMGDNGVTLLDPTHDGPAALDPPEHVEWIHVIRYR